MLLATHVRRFATSAQATARFHPPSVSLTAAARSHKQLVRMEAMEAARQERRESRLGPRPEVHNPIVQDTNRTRLFNRHFQERIGLVMLQMPVLLGRGISITRVSVRPDFSEVLVFWVATLQQEEETRQVLEMRKKEIRRAMIDTAGLGELPKLTFVKDLAYLHSSHMTQLFSTLDTGPQEEVTEAERDQLLWQQLEGLDVCTNGAGLDRGELMEELGRGLERSKASHRYSGGTAAEFNAVYRATLERDDGSQKIFIKKNIKQFLSQRKKAKYDAIRRDDELVDLQTER